MRSGDLLDAYVRGLCSLCGAHGVSLYVPSQGATLTGALLSHDGEAAAVPELADLVRAEEFVREIAARLGGMPEGSSAPTAVEIPSRAPDGRLIGIFSRSSARVPERRQAGRASSAARTPATAPRMPELWVGLRLSGASQAALIQLPPRSEAPRVVEAPWAWLLGFAAELAVHNRQVSEILDDPVTGLPSRAELQARLERAIEAGHAHGQPVTLLMVNPDDFGALNERMSREAADDVIREMAQRMLAAHRGSDLVARYGAVVFASILVDTGGVEGVRRAREILERLQSKPFLAGAVPLRFSVAAASFEPPDPAVRRALDLIRRANLALRAAKRLGGGRLEAWQAGGDEEVGYLDRLTGIFTGELARDYRNMAVLSDTVSSVAGSADPAALAARVVRALDAAMKPDHLGLFEWRGDGTLDLLYGESRRRAAPAALEPHESLAFGAAERLLLDEARRSRRAVEARSGPAGADEVLSFAVPLLVGDEVLGALYLAGRAASMSLDSSDLVFLEALAAQVALALDRARLGEQRRRLEERERQHLRAEVDELRSALHKTNLLYRSEQMEALIEKVRRVAPTDATVLITGESGTGKEMVARAVHELSPRRDGPFVVVDCGAIPTTLIESELFGHEKGAFTGAQQRQPGRLVQADRGTLLLDEIGELPLEAQSRLLRFVQEKRVTPVGGRASRSVNVRVIAATNRDLLADQEAGLFRADLYHRLNVVRLEIPALRARQDDLLHLADHFSETYSLLYGRGPFSFSAEAEATILRHAWPGNVRELQNRVMRAVILCQGSTIMPADLGLVESPAAGGPASPATPRPEEALVVSPSSDAWERLRSALGRQVEEALERPGTGSPLGRWLTEDLLREADVVAAGVASRAAALLGMPETTFRRRLDAAADQAGSARPASWPEVRSCLARLLRSESVGSARSPWKRAQQVLLEEVLARAPESARVGAALLGVTLATFRRRCAAAGRAPARQ